MKKQKAKKNLITKEKPAQNKYLFFGMGVVAAIVLNSLIYTLQRKQHSDSTQTIYTFDECAANKKSAIIETYPKQCQYIDGKTYIQDVQSPVDITNWETINTEMGFSFKCPPSWKCYSANDFNTAGFGERHYKNINVTLRRVTSSGYSQSILRHPDFSSPRQWFMAIESKNQGALTAKNSVIRSVDGTDGKDYPIYYGLSYESMRQTDTSVGKAVLFDSNPDSTNSILFLSLSANSDVIVISINPEYAVNDPIVEAVLHSFSIERFE